MFNRTIKGWVTNEEEICGAWFGLWARENVSSQKRKSCNSPECKDHCNITPLLHSSPRLNLDLWITFPKRKTC